MAPRQEAVHNDLVRTVVVPGASRCVRRDQPARYLRSSACRATYRTS
jgi:hypothetical protein